VQTSSLPPSSAVAPASVTSPSLPTLESQLGPAAAHSSTEQETSSESSSAWTILQYRSASCHPFLASSMPYCEGTALLPPTSFEDAIAKSDGLPRLDKHNTYEFWVPCPNGPSFHGYPMSPPEGYIASNFSRPIHTDRHCLGCVLEHSTTTGCRPHREGIRCELFHCRVWCEGRQCC
jgi:hypothetical protein